MVKHSLKAKKRTTFGKKLNALRKTGILPGNVFGKDVKSESVELVQKDFDKVYKEAGETSVVYIAIEGEEKERPVLVSGIAINPVTGMKLHIDFHQVNLKEKVTANVPVELIGESESVKEGTAVLNQSLQEIEIEALPTNIPESFILDISSLKEIGDHFKVSDIKKEDGVEIKSELDQIIVSLSEPQKEEVVPEPTDEAVVDEEKKTEGEEKSEEKSEEKPEEKKAE